MNLDSSSILLLLLGIAIAIAALALRAMKTPGAISLAVMAGSLTLWILVYIIQPDTLGPWAQHLLNALTFLCMTVAASAQLSFALSYTQRVLWTPRLTIALLGVFPLLTQVLYWIPPSHDLLFIQHTQPAGPAPVLDGIWVRLLGIYIFSLVGASVLLLLDAFRGKPKHFFPISRIVPLAGVLPLIAQLFGIIDLQPANLIDPSLLAFTLAAIGFTYGLLRLGTVASLAATRETVVEEMEDGWMVLDPKKNIVDMNPAAEKMIGIPRESAYGQPLHSIVDLSNASENMQELEMKRSFKSRDGWRYLNIRISSLGGAQAGKFGHLIVWRDITERRLAEDARQRARDEMFVLLNAISSEASQAMNLEDFLSESIYQIIYPFRSQIVAIFVSDEKKQDKEDQNFQLTSHFGLSPEAAASMPSISSSSPLISSLLRNGEPLLVEEPVGESQLPPPLRETGSACMLVLPLITQTAEKSRFLGCICLGRKEKPDYSQDEIVRLSTISDHLANLIDSERRRKLAISLSERKRLIRDLHVSVSHKLYGLLAVTEATQASIEAGNPVDPSEVLAKIGDHARQAVKEMRLFLYQMEPVNLEKEGLVAALHHRLAAVEGRADMKARFVAAENIVLSTDKEIELYLIAQEALNNIIRHAHAKNVMVNLKQGRKNVILEIEDDGHGFDPKSLDRGGLGLPNMSERTSKIKGKLKIHSKPGYGTKVVVTIPRELPVALSKNRS